eukprot:4715333-Prymnesium_polylepis.1
MRAVINLMRNDTTIFLGQETHATESMSNALVTLLKAEGKDAIFSSGVKGDGLINPRAERGGVCIIWSADAYELIGKPRHVVPGRILFARLRSLRDPSTTLNLINVYLDPPPGSDRIATDRLHTTHAALLNAIGQLEMEHGSLLIAGDFNGETRRGREKRAKQATARKLAEAHIDVLLDNNTGYVDLIKGRIALTVLRRACSVYVTASRSTFSRKTLSTPRVSS